MTHVLTFRRKNSVACKLAFQMLAQKNYVSSPFLSHNVTRCWKIFEASVPTPIKLCQQTLGMFANWINL